VKTILIIQSSK